MTRLTEYFMKNPRVTRMVVFLILTAGIMSMATLQREELPSIDLETVKISTACSGASPEDVEINVTCPIEDELMEVENIRRLTSMSMENLSIVVAEIDPATPDPGKTKTDIRDAVSRVTDLPESVTDKPMIEELSTSYPMYELALHGDVPELELRRRARDLEARLREIPGISSIEMIGYRDREIAIEADTDRLRKDSVSLADIMNAVRSRNVRSTGGTVKSFVSEKKVITLSQYRDPMEVRDVIVRSNFEGYQVRLTEVASVTDTFEEPKVLYRGNGRPAIAFLVSKQDGADVIDLSDSLKEVVRDFSQNLPEGVTVDEIYDFSHLTRTMVSIVSVNAAIGFFLVLAVMVIFLDCRSAFWAAAGIPFSVLGAMALFAPFGININTVSLGSIILIIGIIVDDAIVVSEKIFSLKLEGMDPRNASLTGVRRMLVPVTASVSTTVLAFLPVLFIPGVMGDFMKQIPVVITVTLLFSLAESFLFMPAHLLHARPPVRAGGRGRWMDRLRDRYRELLSRFLAVRLRVTAAFIAVLAAAMTLSAIFLQFRLEEDIDPDYFGITVEAPRGTPLLRTAEMVRAVENAIVETVPGTVLKSFTTQVGHHNTSMEMGGAGGLHSNRAICTVYLAPASDRDVTAEELMARLQERLDGIREASGFDRLDAGLLTAATGKAVEITWISDNDYTRKKFENETVDFLKSIPGVTGIETSAVPGKDELRIELDHPALGRTGLTALDVAATVRTAFDGTEVTSIRHRGEDISYRVTVKNAGRLRAAGILELPVANGEGRLVPLKHVAGIDQGPGPSAIRHYGGRRSVTVTADVDDGIITSHRVNELIKDRFAKTVKGTPGVLMKTGGQEEEMALSMKGFYFALAIGVIAIYFILVVLFNSYLQPAIIMSVIPFAASSVFLTLMIHGRPLVFISLVGMLGLIGVVVNDTIVMINQLNRECRENGFSGESIARGAADRFRPIVLTSLTTFAGLIPTAYGIGGDLPLIRPLVLVMAWGLLITTWVTLFFIPVLYSFVRKGKEQNI